MDRWGGGIPSSGELPNGWIVRYSATQTFLPDGFNIEGGIPPDIRSGYGRGRPVERKGHHIGTRVGLFVKNTHK
ncbi:MAG: hypothetical protein IPL49_21995 [Saprospirales bacterium]|nr:hypothetical protein [Saprospirales bacterium]